MLTRRLGYLDPLVNENSNAEVIDYSNMNVQTLASFKYFF